MQQNDPSCHTVIIHAAVTIQAHYGRLVKATSSYTVRWFNQQIYVL